MGDLRRRLERDAAGWAEKREGLRAAVAAARHDAAERAKGARRAALDAQRAELEEAARAALLERLAAAETVLEAQRAEIEEAARRTLRASKTLRPWPQRRSGSRPNAARPPRRPRPRWMPSTPSSRRPHRTEDFSRA